MRIMNTVSLVALFATMTLTLTAKAEAPDSGEAEEDVVAYSAEAEPLYVSNCGWTSCNWTFTRSYTKQVMRPLVASAASGVGALSGAAMCGALPPPANAACVAWVAINFFKASAEVIHASETNACFVARFQYVGALSPINAFATGVSNGEHCID